ncbi:MAG: cobyrinate a,c-diamide synthase [Fretibacterium sp.]|nr:cobyrinate a,c-diamide synthase [Fretibacterium sp.]
MNSLLIPRLLIAAAGSGSGKTTIVGGLLAALRRRGLHICAYKTGPDYIDPGHQRRAGQCEVYNLDTWMMDRAAMAGLFARTAQGADIAVVEGVMGLFDGQTSPCRRPCQGVVRRWLGRAGHALRACRRELSGPVEAGEDRGGSSSAEIAKLLGLPVVLVIDARSMGESAAAVALGFREYDRSVDLRGVILNRVGSDSHRDIIASALDRVGIPLLGTLKRDGTLALEERHLGLTPVEEAEDAGRVERVRAAVEAGLDVDALIALAQSAPPLKMPSPLPGPRVVVQGVRLAVARDEAFSFYYPESLEVLERRGAELVFFSPLRDSALPPADGMILGGGFPEMFAAGLEANVSMRRDIAAKAESGLPILAECGGLMYLSRSLTDFEGRSFRMAGVVPASCQMNSRLQRVGYVEATTLCDTVLGPRGTVLRGHEFHFSSLRKDAEEPFPDAFLFRRRRTGETYPGGYARGGVLASYLHLNLLGCPAAAEYFLKKCEAFASPAL